MADYGGGTAVLGNEIVLIFLEWIYFACVRDGVSNILVAQEVLKGYNRLNGPKRCALKIYIQKAYDTVDWAFLKDILVMFGFNEKMVHWIMTCVTSTSFSIYINGENQGFFKGGRGLRQGDPMSPYLFTLSIKVIKDVLEEFGQVSGLLPNVSKSMIFFGNVPAHVKARIIDVLPFAVGRLQLVASVSAMQLYWASVYVIPQGVIEDIEKLLKGFLWDQSESSKGKAKVAWNSESLWGKWVNVIKLNGRSFWDIQPGSNDSIGWKFLLVLRDKVKPHICVDRRNDRDEWSWITNDGNKVPFSTQQVWRDFRSNKSKVIWHHVVWFKYFDPKHAFVLWLAAQNRLNTQDRMQSWFPNKVFLCSLCGKKNDSINHLFFLCDYSVIVWDSLRSKLVFRGLPYILPGIMNAMAQYPYSNNIWCIINRIVIAACVYFIWIERNNRLFSQKKKVASVLCKDIQDYIKLKLISFRVKDSVAVHKAAKMWDLNWGNSCFSM
ncbi:uncharacterized protein [Rutidosis leptorrhynchoides]|uniref:uncharacterized protein n=1 Tax=Rutidosis leptorrhynchoides TaxID=125765 RepID=UPI003A995616